MNNEEYKKIFEIINLSPWKDDTPIDQIIALGNKAYNDMKTGKSKSKILYRLCGQSGSGKTTQLRESVLHVLKSKNHNPMVFAVRDFACYHPKYQEYIQTLPKGEIREKTNGFALRCLFVALSIFVEKGYEILYEITILEENFERFFDEMLKKNNYKQFFNILSVSKEQSDAFISKRKLDKNNKEFNRVVLSSSAEYFYQNLNKNLPLLISLNQNEDCVIWNAYDKLPIFYGKFKDSYKYFLEYKNKTKMPIFSEKELLESKKIFYNNVIN